MTEQEWLECTDPAAMLQHLNRPQGDRKFFLFALACCRKIWCLLPQPEMRHGVEVAERFAEGQATQKELQAADWQLEGALYGGVEYYANRPGMALPAGILRLVEDLQSMPTDQLAAIVSGEPEELASDPLRLLTDAGYFASHVLSMNSCEPHSPTLRWYQRFLQLSVLHDIFGNPFRTLTVEPAWLTPTAVAVAQAIYAERAFDRLPILGDALEDAGCTNADLLHHLRQGGEHVRGCWALDCLLEKDRADLRCAPSFR